MTDDTPPLTFKRQRTDEPPDELPFNFHKQRERPENPPLSFREVLEDE